MRACPVLCSLGYDGTRGLRTARGIPRLAGKVSRERACDLDRRNHRRPPRPVPQPGHGRAPARPPSVALAPGPLAVPHPARRRTGRLDPAEVIRTAIAFRDLVGSRDIAAVLDARIRPRIDPLLPQRQGAWAGRVPRLPDPARHAYLARIAAMMDDRTRRLGQHGAQTTPSWAVSTLGPVPADSAARRQWEDKAASIAAYREMYATTIPMTRSVPSPPARHRISGPRGTRLSPPSARQASRTSGPCSMGSCGWPATPTRPRPPGRPRMPGRSCGCPGSAPSTPPWQPSGPTPRQSLPQGRRV